MRIPMAACAVWLAASLLALPDAQARDPARDLTTLASRQLATLEPGAVPAPPRVSPGVSTVGQPLLAPEQLEPAGEVALARIQALDAIVEDARKRAQVEYLAEKLRRPAQVVRHFVHLAWAEARRRPGLSPELLIAIMYKESTFRPRAQSSYGAQGLMQVVRRWHRDKLQASESLFDPAVNVRVGAEILEEYLEMADGDLSKALAKYSGRSRGYAQKVLSESERLARVGETAAAEVVMMSWPINASSPGPGLPG